MKQTERVSQRMRDRKWEWRVIWVKRRLSTKQQIQIRCKRRRPMHKKFKVKQMISSERANITEYNGMHGKRAIYAILCMADEKPSCTFHFTVKDSDILYSVTVSHPFHAVLDFFFFVSECKWNTIITLKCESLFACTLPGWIFSNRSFRYCE